MATKRAIIYCEPKYALAGQCTTWRFIYQAGESLPAGARLKFDLRSPGRDIDWEPPVTSLRAARNVIYGMLDESKPIAAMEVEAPDSIVPQYEFTLPKELSEGESFTISIGAPPRKGSKEGEDEKHGNRAQLMVQRRRPFLLYVDPRGKGDYGDPETFTLDVRGNQLETIRVLAPSLVGKNKRFDITIRFEDAFGNLTCSAPEDTLIDLSYENLRENLNWKLFVPETGFVTLPNLYFNETGVYRIRLENLANKEIYLSDPIICLAESALNLYWGLLHGESERVDSTVSIEACLRHFRDEKNLNFFATSCFDSAEETPNEIWKLLSQNVANFNEEDRFVVLLGFQWFGGDSNEGLRQLVYYKDGKSILRQRELRTNSLDKIYRSSAKIEMLSILCFTMGSKGGYDFSKVAPEYERLVEIYNAWGSSECMPEEGNPRPIASQGKKGVKAVAKGSVLAALKANHRFGFVGGGLDDRGIYADFYDGDQIQYSPGLTAILAPKHARDAFLQALHQRRCYATTGERIILGLFLISEPMGSELSTAERPGLRVNRHLTGYVAGTAPLKTVEIIRNGEVLNSLDVEGDFLEFTYDDLDPALEVALPGGEGEKPPFLFYYLRVTQEDEHMAWSSPIWVDVEEPKTKSNKARKNY